MTTLPAWEFKTKEMSDISTFLYRCNGQELQAKVIVDYSKDKCHSKLIDKCPACGQYHEWDS